MTAQPLAHLGWKPFFQAQLSIEELETARPARVWQQHRSRLELAWAGGRLDLELSPTMPPLTVGDWILVDDHGRLLRLLERRTLFSRKAAGTEVREQLIAANIDIAFVVCSLNDDFNLNRIERYLTLVNQAGAQPVVVLTKADISDDAETQRARVQALDTLLVVETVNALEAQSVQALRAWCRIGDTICLLGSSGAGKSTLVNTLCEREATATGSIREADSKGRHTTTARELYELEGGGLLLDTPGMRELQLADVDAGLAATFADIETLAASCRFGDCQHQGEPGCAVERAIEAGSLDARRLDNYRKLGREQALASASLAERRARDKAQGKMYRTILSETRGRRGQ